MGYKYTLLVMASIMITSTAVGNEATAEVQQVNVVETNTTLSSNETASNIENSIKNIQSLKSDFSRALKINESLISLGNIVSRLMDATTKLGNNNQLSSAVNYIIDHASKAKRPSEDIAVLCTQMVLDTGAEQRKVVINSIINNNNVDRLDIQKLYNLLSESDPIAAEQLLESIKALDNNKDLFIK